MRKSLNCAKFHDCHDYTRTSRVTMTPAAILTLIFVSGVVWGGFAFVLATAVRKEGRKVREG